MVTPRAPTGVPMLVCGRAVLVPCGRTPPRRYSGFVVVVTVGGAAVPRQSAISKMAAVCSDGRGMRPLFFLVEKKKHRACPVDTLGRLWDEFEGNWTTFEISNVRN